jgi:hypothetical protein
VIIDGATGTHACNKSNDAVEGIRINFAQNLVKIPRGVEKVFKNLVLLGIYANKNLKRVTQGDMRAFPELKYLYLDQNGIEAIESDLFKFNKKLEVIKLFKNNIFNIDPLVFSELKSLRVLDLSDNNCQKSVMKATCRTDVEKIISDVRDGQCQRHTIDNLTSIPELLGKLQERHEELYKRFMALEEWVKEHCSAQVPVLTTGELTVRIVIALCVVAVVIVLILKLKGRSKGTTMIRVGQKGGA